MSKVICTIEDLGNDDISVNWDFDPPLETNRDVEATPSQYVASKLIDYLYDICIPNDGDENEKL